MVRERRRWAVHRRRWLRSRIGELGEDLIANVIVRPTLFLTIGLPGAGKTTIARQLAEERRILRLTPDEWMAPLFADSDADGRRDTIAESTGARFELTYLEIDESERRLRASRRWREHPESTFPMSDADHDRFAGLCQPPTAQELAYAPVPVPPLGFESWQHWAS
jgi:predicted kinase